MKTKHIEIKIADLVEGYHEDGEIGVKGYGGKLDIRPPYQRNFVYKEAQRNAVINSVRKGLPLNGMHWAKRADNTYEIVDGQQRTISICRYVKGMFSVGGMGFHNLQSDEKEQILDYRLTIYVCDGTDSEKLDWFQTINIAGETLTKQELRNAVYHGAWVTDAKKYFSASNCPAYGIANKLLRGSHIRQDYLETAIKWASADGKIEEYMSAHQHHNSAVDLWNNFRSVIDWVNAVFPKYRRAMKGVDWGKLYNAHSGSNLDAGAIEEEVVQLMMDDDVSKKAGIYEYVLSREEKHLSIRAFTEAMRLGAYERQNGRCAETGEEMDIEEMDADHITPWSQGGKTTADNCQMLSKAANRRKGAK